MCIKLLEVSSQKLCAQPAVISNHLIFVHKLSSVNISVFLGNFRNFLLPSLDEWFGDSSDFIFQDDL